MGTIKQLPIVKSLLVNTQAHKNIKLESVEHNIPMQEIVEYKILKPLSKKDLQEIRKNRKK